MPRASLMLVALFAIGCIAALGYSCATRVDAARPGTDGKPLTASHPGRPAEAGNPQTNSAQPAPPPSGGDAEHASSMAHNDATSSQAIPAETVAKWVADATGEDSTSRAAAIVALGTAPKSEAVPVLQKVLSSGEPHVDRPLALRALRTLALNQGDADSGIRNALRHAIYHGDDEAVAQGAQNVLSEIEGDPRPHAPTASP